MGQVQQHEAPLHKPSALLLSAHRLGWQGVQGCKAHFTAMEATNEESRPPDSSTPKGTSDMSRLTTEATSESWIASRLAR